MPVGNATLTGVQFVSYLFREEPQLDKMGVYVFHLEKMLNDFKFFRQRKQIAKDTLQNEFEVAEDQESREQVLSLSQMRWLTVVRCPLSWLPLSSHSSPLCSPRSVLFCLAGWLP